MMQKFTIAILSSLYLLFVFACASQQRCLQHADSDHLKAMLLSDQVVERSEPFSIRNFNPYIDDKWIGQAISYGCYRAGQAPGSKGPSKAEILEDLNTIAKHWSLIRVYNADDDTQRILEVIRDNNLPIKLMLGIWLENESVAIQAEVNNHANVLRGIELANAFKDIVIAINVGNETQVFWSGHKLERDALIKYIRFVRKYTSIPITTADDYNFWNKPESTTVAAEVDFIVTHIYPLWNGKTLEEAIPWLNSTYQMVNQVHPHKLLVLGEIGWATAYNADKKGDGEQGTLVKGEVSIKAQETFLLELDAWINSQQITTFLFEAFDEPWKGGGKDTGTNEIEKNWGVFYLDRTPKQSFTNYQTQKEPK